MVYVLWIALHAPFWPADFRRKVVQRVKMREVMPKTPIRVLAPHHLMTSTDHCQHHRRRHLLLLLLLRSDLRATWMVCQDG